MAEPLTVELDAQYRQLREECGLLDRSARGKLLVSGPGRRRVPAGPADQRHRGARPGRRLLRGAARPQGPHAGRHAGAAARRRARPLARHRARGARGRRAATSRPTRSGARSRSRTSARERAILSLIGPATGAVAGTAPLPLYACEAATVAGIECLAVGTEEGIDLIVAAAERDRLRAALLAAGAAEVDAAAAEILRIEAGPAPLRRRDEHARRCPPRPASSRRPSASPRAATSARSRSPASTTAAGPTVTCAGLRLSAPVEAGAGLTLDGKEVGRVGSACVSPALGPIALAIVRREAEPGAELVAGEDGVTARVVDLPFG